MGQTKRKLDSEKKSKAKPSSVAPRKTSSSAEDVVILQDWHQELSLLQSRTFSDVDEAIEALADAVSKKMTVGDLSTTEVKEFLVDLIDTDPALKDEIKATVRIKD